MAHIMGKKELKVKRLTQGSGFDVLGLSGWG